MEEVGGSSASSAMFPRGVEARAGLGDRHEGTGSAMPPLGVGAEAGPYEHSEEGVRKPIRCADPGAPTEEEKKEHELTHLPYRSWCRHCVRGKGRALDHKRCDRQPRLRTVHFDYCFMGNIDEQDTRCILVGKEEQTKYMLATVVPKKGMSHEFPAKRVMAYLREMGLDQCELDIKHDQEAALADLVNEVVRQRGSVRTIREQAPVGSSQSNGIIERGVLTIEGQVRVLKSALEERIGRVKGDHPIIAWLVEFAAVLVNRYEVGVDGRTPYERMRGKTSKMSF